MSQRKLQQDIDKLLKKVKEGLETFDEVYEKFESSDPTNSSYREKLESDLKREIKKLQKQREQIKTWLSKEDVKDKSNVLLENRRFIENDMERFKTIEKLMKAKQFSNEALTNPDSIIDPRDLKKREIFIFIQDCIQELQKQLETYENDDNYEGIARHEFHINNLQNILKLLTRNQIDTNTIDEFKDDIKYYVENNDDPDFVEYDTIYEDMGCEIQFANDLNLENTNDINTSTLSSANDYITSTTPVKPNNNPSTTTSTPSAATATATLRKQDRSSPKKLKKSTLIASPSKQQDEDLSKATASATTTTTTPAATTTLFPATSTAVPTNMNDIKTEDKDIHEHQHVQQPSELSFPKDITSQINDIISADIEQNQAFRNPLFNEELKYWLNTKKTLMQPYKEMPQSMLSQLESSLLNCPDSLDADSPYLYRKPLSLPHPTSIFFPNEPIRFIYPFDLKLSNNATNNNTNTSSQKKVKNDIYSNTSLAKIFTKFDLDTLFFIFYHYQGTYEQFLSSRELNKNRNWQFNKVDRCWYYKEIEKLPPGMNKSEEESWRYFDYKKSWLARRCSPDFVYKKEDFEKL
ncbi:hypothetical protein KAFR_0H00860 [Kazachstania africana CBS 2517]|uniref:General negative regulator of transcription subunit n=1 Tax=Kazachstania africana (strain ATCC 22294 / BCRC 22015 / CBS 2517 / CECT 1963 / NBRC 1671 / NRRL Y-8276) TaxID=1071382 RepID=H2AYU0_KAZAF|nr:hypothetical protein KAFR_0H00860 [Kazachstania africana CBS 2517]CCF59496.1 hypothetical protein KAFR_0H00860 [Kazachstania africana CBS 2517]